MTFSPPAVGSKTPASSKAGRKMYREKAGRSPGNNVYTYHKVFHPLPWQFSPWRDMSPVLLLTGAAGGGKSVLAGEKVHGYCLRYPGTTALIMRKVEKSIHNSVIAMMTNGVIGKDPRVKHMKVLRRFEYENGSLIVYMGMQDANQRDQIRSLGQSGGIDIAWLEEATEFEEEDYNEVLARMRGRAAPWRQIILSTNPGPPAHWINLRLIIGGEASVYYSKAIDNPWNPEDYLQTLQKLTGVQRSRLVLGKWSIGTGVVFDNWLDEYNAKDSSGKEVGNVVISGEYIKDGGPVVWAIDDGYSGEYDRKSRMFTAKSHPRAIMLCQLRADGTVSIFDEDYAVGLLADDHIIKMLKYSEEKGYARPHYAVRDRSAASLGGALKKNGIISRFDTATVEEGVKEMQQWLAPDENKVRRLVCHPRCRFFRYEMLSYSRDKSGSIIKEHDHGPDGIRYLCWSLAYGKSPVVDIATFYSEV